MQLMYDAEACHLGLHLINDGDVRTVTVSNSMKLRRTSHSAISLLMFVCCLLLHCGSKKNAPTLADNNYDTVQSILIIFSKLFVNDHKSCAISSVISAK